MLFNKTQKWVLMIWGCDRRDLTIRRLAYAAAYAVNPNVKLAICRTREELIQNWDDGRYGLYYRNAILPKQKSADRNFYEGGSPA